MGRGGERQPGCMVEQQAQLATRPGVPCFGGPARTSGQLGPKWQNGFVHRKTPGWIYSNRAFCVLAQRDTRLFLRLEKQQKEFTLTRHLLGAG